MSEIAGDIIKNLPTDQSVPSHNELQIIDMLFKQKQGTIQYILSQMKDVIIVGLLFIIFSLPHCDGLISKFIPSLQSSQYMLLLGKALLFMLCYFVLKNWYLARKD